MYDFVLLTDPSYFCVESGFGTGQFGASLWDRSGVWTRAVMGAGGVTGDYLAGWDCQNSVTDWMLGMRERRDAGMIADFCLGC